MNCAPSEKDSVSMALMAEIDIGSVFQIEQPGILILIVPWPSHKKHIPGRVTLLSGILIANTTQTAVPNGFARGKTTNGLEFKQSLKHHHSGMFLAGIQCLKTPDARLFSTAA
jgi:hypothetical protein